jgi:mannose-6-phosphate isomerase-like protein (cupin superfamily)
MPDGTPYPYETRLDVKHGPLERIDVFALAATVAHPWFNQTLCRVNDSVVRVGVVRGEYHWHSHADDDEFFLTLEGRLLIDLDDCTVTLDPGQAFVVPKGVRHRTRASERTIIVMVENAGIVPTGDPA